MLNDILGTSNETEDRIHAPLGGLCGTVNDSGETAVSCAKKKIGYSYDAQSGNNHSKENRKGKLEVHQGRSQDVRDVLSNVPDPAPREIGRV